MSEKVRSKRSPPIPHFELIGCYAWSKDKAGRDVGELVGIEPLGITATNDVDALLALKPDCVVYNPMWIDVDELVRILSAGVNVVSSASFITGHNLDAGRDQIEEACKRGGSTMFGSGVSPGFAELLAIVAATGCARVDKVTVAEASDTTFYDSPATEIPVGFGTPIDDPDLQPMAAQGTAVFAEAVRLVADALGVELDEVVCEAEYAQTTEDVDLGSWTIKAGCVAGVFASWQGRVGGKTVVDLNVRWRKGQTLDPDWKVEGDPWKITIDGLPDGDDASRLPAAAGLHREGRDDGRLHGGSATSSPRCRRSTRSRPSSPPRRASSRTTTCR